MSIYYVRHGQTDWNLHGRMQGSTDIALNENGKAQARMTQEKLKDIRIDKIYCSPLTRAKETAQIINENWHLPMTEDARLAERSFGEYEGGLGKHVDYHMLWSITDEKPYVNSEDTISFFARVECFLDSIIDEAQEKNILIVAHGGVSIPYYCYFNGYDFENLNEVMLDNCEVAHMEGKKYVCVQRG